MKVGEEIQIAPGVLIERRCVFMTFAILLAAPSMPGWATPRRPADPRARLSFEEFLGEVVPIARALVGDASANGQDHYLRTVASYAVRLADVPQPAMSDSGQGTGPGTYIGFNPGGDPFTVLHWRMEPHSQIRTHAHTYGNVVTLGLEGSAEVVNYEVEGGPDYASRLPFLARRTNRQILGRGDVNLVNLQRNYIHGSRAGPVGARGLDITTRIRPRDPTPYLILSNPDRDVSEGRWSFDAVRA